MGAGLDSLVVDAVVLDSMRGPGMRSLVPLHAVQRNVPAAVHIFLYEFYTAPGFCQDAPYFENLQLHEPPQKTLKTKWKFSKVPYRIRKRTPHNPCAIRIPRLE